MRIGHGYDVHRLVEGRKLILGGVEIPFERGLDGHSDADVLLHAVMDALLGAAAMRDIGVLFPDQDARFKGISSMLLLEEVMQRLLHKGYRVGNVDVTVLAQRPKLKDHIPQMKENLACALGVDPDRVNIKATTEEGLGFTGRGEGIACHAVCLSLLYEFLHHAVAGYHSHTIMSVHYKCGRSLLEDLNVRCRKQSSVLNSVYVNRFESVASVAVYPSLIC